MKYQKIMNLLDDTTNKFRTRHWIKIKEESLGAYNAVGNNDNNIKENKSVNDKIMFMWL